MRKLWDRTHPVIALLVVIALVIATWFASYVYTMGSLDPAYDPDTGIVWIWDRYGNLNHYRTEVSK